MPAYNLENGYCRIYIESGGFLTHTGGKVVVSKEARGDWSLRCHEQSKDPSLPGKFIFLYHGKADNLQQPVITLNETNNVILSDLGDVPSNRQLWTLEDDTGGSGFAVFLIEP